MANVFKRAASKVAANARAIRRAGEPTKVNQAAMPAPGFGGLAGVTRAAARSAAARTGISVASLKAAAKSDSWTRRLLQMSQNAINSSRGKPAVSVGTKRTAGFFRDRDALLEAGKKVARRAKKSGGR